MQYFEDEAVRLDLDDETFKRLEKAVEKDRAILDHNLKQQLQRDFKRKWNENILPEVDDFLSPQKRIVVTQQEWDERTKREHALQAEVHLLQQQRKALQDQVKDLENQLSVAKKLYEMIQQQVEKMLHPEPPPPAPDKTKRFKTINV